MINLKNCRIFILPVFLYFGALALTNFPAPPQAGSSRLAIFISDLHLGVGKDANGKWHNYEDARWAPEFDLFLKEMDRQGKGTADLVLNGDTFELWQSLNKDCSYADKNLGCTEIDALARLRHVLSNHAPELQSILNFAVSGNNRVIIVPGNHDGALLFDKVAAAVLHTIAAPKERVLIASQGYWISPDHLIYAEHGHQIGEEVNKFDNWPKPFRSKNGQVHLQRTWGEQFVQQYFNDFELKYPSIDNFSEDALGVKYGVAAEGTGGSLQDIGRFVGFYLTKLSWQQMASSLGPEDQSPSWDISAIRAKGEQFLVESIPSDDPLRAAADKALKEGTFGLSLSSLTDDDIKNICNLRHSMRQERRTSGKPPTVSDCPRRSLGATGQKLLSSRNAVFTKHLDQTYKKLADAGITEQAFQLFVYSHTHLESQGFSPMEGSQRQWRPYVVNTGAWQRTIKPEQMDKIMAEKGLSVKEALAKLQPEDLPPCYPVILVAPYTEKPKAALKYWRKGNDNQWSLAGACQ